jgi:hypothetical protein
LIAAKKAGKPQIRAKIIAGIATRFVICFRFSLSLASRHSLDFKQSTEKMFEKCYFLARSFAVAQSN